MFESSVFGWTVLLLSGMFEVMWAAALAESRWPMVRRILIFITGSIISLGGLYFSLMTVPVGAGYGAWVGMGAVTALLYSAAGGRERATPLRLFFVLLLVTGIIGLGVFS